MIGDSVDFPINIYYYSQIFLYLVRFNRELYFIKAFELMRYFKVFGQQSGQPFIECTPFDSDKFALGNKGKFASIDEAEKAIEQASYFYYPRYPTGNIFNRFELRQLSVNFVIIHFYSIDNEKAF